MSFQDALRSTYSHLLGQICMILIAANSLAQSDSSLKSDSSSKPSSERTLAVAATLLKQSSNFDLKRQFTGQIEARRKSQLGFDRVGRISEIYVDRGDEVKKGEPIALLDCDSLLAQRQKLEADLLSAKALLREAQTGPRKETIASARASVAEQNSQYELSEETFKRREQLFKKKLIAKEEFDQAQANRDRWRAMVDGAESRLQELLEGTRAERIESQAAVVDSIVAAMEQIQVEIRKSQLLSPFDGKVLSRDLDEGSVVSPGRPFITIIEHRQLEARVGVAPLFVKAIRKGQTMELDCNGESIQGTVRAIVSELDTATRTQSIILSLDEHAWERVVPGDTVRASFAQEKKSVGFWVPTECLMAGPRGLWNCFVVEKIGANGNGIAALRTVEILHSSGDQSMIAGQISENDVLVSSAPHRIIAGQEVKPIFQDSSR